jgi:hypothetical protein
LVIIGENFQHLLVAGQVNQHGQCIFRDWLYPISLYVPPLDRSQRTV